VGEIELVGRPTEGGPDRVRGPPAGGGEGQWDRETTRDGEGQEIGRFR
jgi:hypothetical protein